MAGQDRPTLLHVCGRYLPLSETFTYSLITGLDRFTHHVVASAIENLQHFPLANVSTPEPEERAWGLARAIDARAIVCHFGPQATIGMPIAQAIDRPIVTIFHGYDKDHRVEGVEVQNLTFHGRRLRDVTAARFRIDHADVRLR